MRFLQFFQFFVIVFFSNGLSDKTVFEQKFAFSLVVFFTCGNFTLIFTVFFQFHGSDFFLNGFPNPFLVHSMLSVLVEPIFSFSPVVFLHMRHLTLIFSFFKIFLSDFFFGNGFPNLLIVRSRSSMCLVNKNFLNCASEIVLSWFFNSSS